MNEGRNGIHEHNNVNIKYNQSSLPSFQDLTMFLGEPTPQPIQNNVVQTPTFHVNPNVYQYQQSSRIYQVWDENQLRNFFVTTLQTDQPVEIELHDFSLLDEHGIMVGLDNVDKGKKVFPFGRINIANQLEFQIWLGVIIQWGGCYDIEGKLERAPVVVIKTNFTCYHLKEPSEKYKPFFKPILKKVNLVSEVIKFINRNPKSSWKKMIQQLPDTIHKQEILENLQFILSQINLLNLPALSSSSIFQHLLKKVKKNYSRESDNESPFKDASKDTYQNGIESKHRIKIEGNLNLNENQHLENSKEVDQGFLKFKERNGHENVKDIEIYSINDTSDEDDPIPEIITMSDISEIEQPIVQEKKEEIERLEFTPVNCNFSQNSLLDLFSLSEFIHTFGDFFEISRNFNIESLLEIIESDSFVALILVFMKFLFRESSTQQILEGHPLLDPNIKETEQLEFFPSEKIYPNFPWEVAPLDELTVSELLRVFLINRNEPKLKDIISFLFANPLLSLSLEQRLFVFMYLSGETLSDQAISQEIDSKLARIRQLKTDQFKLSQNEKKIEKEIVENKKAITKLQKEKDLLLDEASEQKKVLLNSDDEGNTEEKDGEDDQMVNTIKKRQQRLEKQKLAKLVDEQTAELIKERDKLILQKNNDIKTLQTSKKALPKYDFEEELYELQKSLRSDCLGQDTFFRNFWIFSNIDGIFVQDVDKWSCIRSLEEYENLLKSLNEKNKVEKELKNNLGKRYSLFSKTQLNFQQFSAPEFSIITKESVSNQNSEEKILNQMTQLMKQFVNLLFEVFPRHLGIGNRTKIVGQKKELILSRLETASSLDDITFCLKETIGLLQKKMLLFHQTDQIFLNSILTWSQLSLQILALKNSIDWSKATFEVSCDSCAEPEAIQCRCCRIVIICQCKLSDEEKEKEIWTCPKCKNEEFTFPEMPNSHKTFFKIEDENMEVEKTLDPEQTLISEQTSETVEGKDEEIELLNEESEESSREFEPILIEEKESKKESKKVKFRNSPREISNLRSTIPSPIKKKQKVQKLKPNPGDCAVCGKFEPNDNLLSSCDICSKLVHLSCQTPPRTRPSRVPWKCSSCSELMKVAASHD